MIKIGCADFDISEHLSVFDGNNPFMCRILSLFYAYGQNTSFADFWCQYNENGTPVSAICRLDNQVTVYTTEHSDIDELQDFIVFLSPYSLLCDSSANFDLNSHSKTTGRILKYNNALLSCDNSFKICKNSEIKKIFSLLKDTFPENFSEIEFAGFYTDLSHKIRHGCAETYAVCENDNIISCAVISSETDNSAVISAVATQQEYRKKGIGTKLIKAVISDMLIKNRSVYLFRENDNNIGFYNRLNFSEIGSWSEYKILDNKKGI